MSTILSFIHILYLKDNKAIFFGAFDAFSKAFQLFISQ